MTKGTHGLPQKLKSVSRFAHLWCAMVLLKMAVAIYTVWNCKHSACLEPQDRKKHFFDISKYKYLTEVYMLLIERRCQFLLTASHSRRLVYSSQDRPTLFQWLARSIFQDINELCYAFVAFILFQQFKDKIRFASAYRGKYIHRNLKTPLFGSVYYRLRYMSNSKSTCV